MGNSVGYLNGTWNGTDSHWTTGNFSSAGTFNASNGDYVSFPAWPSFSGASYSVSVWFKSTSNLRVGGTQYCGSMPFYLQLNGTSINFAVNNATGNCGNSQAGSSITNPSAWHHAVGVFDGTNAKLYLDGVLKSTGANFTGSYNTSRTDPFVFGRYNCSGGCTYGSGQLDDAKIYNKALTTIEITDLYNGGSGCTP